MEAAKLPLSIRWSFLRVKRKEPLNAK